MSTLNVCTPAGYRMNEESSNLSSFFDKSEAVAAKIQQLMPKIIKKEDHEDIEWLGKGSNLVFKVKGTPYVYKMDRSGSSKERDERFANMTKAQEVCLTHHLGLLVIPQATKFDVKADGITYALIAEESLDLNPNESTHEEFYHRFSTELNETVRQLATFVANTGFNDVTWRNIPVLNETSNFHGSRRVALIDLEHMNSVKNGFCGDLNGSCGLIGCASSKEQIDDIIAVAHKQGIVMCDLKAAAEQRLERLENDEKLRDFYSRKGITTGKEPVQVEDWNSLGLDLSEEDKARRLQVNLAHDGSYSCRYETTIVTLKKVADDVIAEMNKLIQESPTQASLKGKRRLILSFTSELLLGYRELPSSASILHTPQEERWLYRIVQALIKTDHIFALEKINAGGYYIQA